MAGSNVWQAILGFSSRAWACRCSAWPRSGISHSTVFDLSSKVNRPYAMFFTCALYLTIGPFFAIPRCATTSFTVGLEQVLPQNGSNTLYLLLFSVAAFFLHGALFRTAPGQDPDLGRQNSEPLLSRLPRHSGRRRAPLSECGHRGCRAARRLCVPAVFCWFPRRVQHHGRAGESCLRHHRRAGHP